LFGGVFVLLGVGGLRHATLRFPKGKKGYNSLRQVDRQCPNRVVERLKQLINVIIGLKDGKMNILACHNFYPKWHEHRIYIGREYDQHRFSLFYGIKTKPRGQARPLD
jgi:hypothetical protein